jgi:hypothetical protein
LPPQANTAKVAASGPGNATRTTPKSAFVSTISDEVFRAGLFKLGARVAPIAFEVELGRALETRRKFVDRTHALDAKATHLQFFAQPRDQIPHAGFRNQPQRIDRPDRGFAIAILIANPHASIVPHRAPQDRQQFARRLALIPASLIDVNARARFVGSAALHVGQAAVQFFQCAIEAALHAEIGERARARDEERANLVLVEMR